MATKVVRVEIDAALWREFKVAAVESDRTVSRYLTYLVEREVKRARTARRRRETLRGGDSA